MCGNVVFEFTDDAFRSKTELANVNVIFAKTYITTVTAKIKRSHAKFYFGICFIYALYLMTEDKTNTCLYIFK